MNRLIIIGNGFDLSHGVKTRFIDFLNNSYTPKIISSIIEHIQQGVRNYGQVKLYEDELIKIEHTLPDPHLKENLNGISEFGDFITKIKDKVDLKIKSLLLQRFLNEIDSNNNWVNIETLYFKTLYIVTNNKQGDNKPRIKEFNEKFKFIITEFENYLKGVLKKFKLKQTDTSHLEFIRDYQKIFYQDFDFKTDSRIMFLNFNYTNILENHIDNHEPYLHRTINYIHGQVGNRKNPIVMGFGDEHDEKFKEWDSNENHELFRYIKSINYFKTPNYQQLNSFLNSEKYQVFVIGHSCGISDRTLLREIFEHKNCKSIKLFYYRDKEGNTDFFEKSVEVMRHFENKMLVRQRVFFDEKDKMVQLSDYMKNDK